jgi:hypothetical protein
MFRLTEFVRLHCLCPEQADYIPSVALIIERHHASETGCISTRQIKASYMRFEDHLAVSVKITVV